MSTTRAVFASVVGLGLSLVLGVAGALAIYNTKDGQVQGSSAQEVLFPDTPTGALAVLDQDDNLASLVVLAIRPSDDDDADAGVGGTIVPIPVSADVSGGVGPERLPLDETVSLFGSASLQDELPALLGVSIDQIAVVSRAELDAMLAPVGPTNLSLPVPVTGNGGSVIAEAGATALDGAQMAEVLASRNPDVTGIGEYDADVAVWRAFADAIGDGLSTPLALTVGESTAAVGGRATIGELVGRLTSGPVSVQPLRSDPVVSVDLNPRGIDAVALDRVEVSVVFGHVAPSRVAAPYAGYTFRLVSSFSDEQLPAGVARLDVAYTATKALVAIETNVRSVDTVAADADAATVVEVTDEGLLLAGERLGDIFGPVEVRIAERRIAGIDMVVTLGTDYLATLDTDVVTPTTGSDAGPETDSAGAQTTASDGAATTVAEDTFD